jgi:hypothetical protein
MPLAWGESGLGNLAQFDQPTFRTGEGLGAALAERRRREMFGAQFGAELGQSIAEGMRQRQKEKIADALADQIGEMYGLEVPKQEGFLGKAFGGGDQRLAGLMARIKAQEEFQTRPQATTFGGEEYYLTPKEKLAAKLAQQRIDTGGGSAEGPETIWHEGREWRRTKTGWIPVTPLKPTEATGTKPRTRAQQEKLEVEVAIGRAEAEKEKAANIKKGLEKVPFSMEAELNTKAKQLGVDPVTGAPIAPSGGENTDVLKLRADAEDAIRRGADPEAVRQAFREQTGGEL